MSQFSNWQFVHMMFILIFIPLMSIIFNDSIISLNLNPWFNIQMFSLSLNFKFDQLSTLFTLVALFITWSILEFASWYMAMEPKNKLFNLYLILFLTAMIVFVTADNFFQLFMGWEGVGIMSFLLIGWWYGRTNANTASLQAMIYNRVGDAGLVFSMAWIVMSANSWELEQIFTLSNHFNLSTPLLLLVVAATGKSAQFSLHPWLPAAMEGPTPVSALLHSSTMVVAGILLLVRLNPLLNNNSLVLKTCLYLGAITTLFAAACALTQNDIKKIVAFSTSSQLGLMMVSLGLNLPHLAFFHVCTHAFFKAMLFLCAGSMIHNLNNEQDIRNMGGAYKSLPATTKFTIIGSLALVGTPFLAGFFSKDAIIEAATSSYLNSYALALTLIATCFTAVYSTRMIFLLSSFNPQSNLNLPLNENHTPLSPIRRLAWGSIIMGLILNDSFSPLETPILTLPSTLKLMAVLLSLLGVFSALQITLIVNKTNNEINKSLFHFSNSLFFFSLINHRLSPYGVMYLAENSSTKFEKSWSEFMGSLGISTLLISTVIWIKSNRAEAIKLYLTMFTYSIVIYMSYLFLFT